MSATKRARLVVAGFAIMIIASACATPAASPEPDGSDSQSTPTVVSQQDDSSGNEGNDSRAKEYRSIDDLANDSAAVVVVEGTGTVGEHPVANVKFPVADMTVLKVVAGTVDDASTVTVLSPALNADPHETTLSQKKQFLLFLTPYIRQVGEATGLWVTTGGPAGMYMQQGEGQYERTDSESTALPASLTVDDLDIPALHSPEYFINTAPGSDR